MSINLIRLQHICWYNANIRLDVLRFWRTFRFLHDKVRFRLGSIHFQPYDVKTNGKFVIFQCSFSHYVVQTDLAMVCMEYSIT